MNRSRLASLVAAAALVLVAFAGAPAVASSQADAPAGQAAFVRAAHFSPDTGGVDVYLTAFSGGTSALWLSNVGYGDLSTYRRIAAGIYAVSMRAHGASASTAAVLTWTLDLRPGAAYTAAAVGKNAQLRGVVVKDTLDPPAPGTGLVRVIQASGRAGHVSVSADNGSTLTADTPFGSTSGYVAVKAGRWTVTARSRTVPGLSGTLRLSVGSGSITSVVLLDTRGDGVVLRGVVDAAGAGSVPRGPVPAGGGGTAPSRHSDFPAVISWVALAGALMLLCGVRSGRRRTARRS